MKLRVGYELVYECAQPTPMLLMLNTHYSRVQDVLRADVLRVDPPVPITQYRDGFGNLCSRIVAPQGYISLSTTALLNISDRPETLEPYSYQVPVEALPDECLVFLLGSRYCETDLLSDVAWQLFGKSPGPGESYRSRTLLLIPGSGPTGLEDPRNGLLKMRSVVRAESTSFTME